MYIYFIMIKWLKRTPLKMFSTITFKLVWNWNETLLIWVESYLGVTRCHIYKGDNIIILFGFSDVVGTLLVWVESYLGVTQCHIYKWDNIIILFGFSDVDHVWPINEDQCPWSNKMRSPTMHLETQAYLYNGDVSLWRESGLHGFGRSL